MSPFITDKSSKLEDDDETKSETSEVSSILNDVYIYVAPEIGFD